MGLTAPDLNLLRESRVKTCLFWVMALTLSGSGIAGAQAPSASAEATTPMAADANPGFEVSTVKPSRPDQPNTTSGQMGHRVVMSNTTVLFLMSFAYDVQEKQVADPPAWVASSKFDFDGVADTPGEPNLEQLKRMLQKLLADRFQLKFHREKRELSAYVLTIAKSGMKLNQSHDDPHGMPSLLMQPGFPKVAAMKARNMSMTDFARLMQSGIVDRPVVDQTGLTGRYEFLLRWTPDETQFLQAGARMSVPGNDADAPSLFSAVQEQLGLRLSAEKRTPVEVLVLDHIDKPSEN